MIVIDKTDATFAPLDHPNDRQPGGHVTAIIKMRYTIQDDGTLSSYSKDEQPPIDGDITYADDLGPAVRHPSDIPDYKPMVDVIVNGHACAPAGTQVAQLTVALEVAGHRKELLVFGDRFWQVDRNGAWYITEPAAFEKMPMRWEKAFGSLFDMRNPIGKGGDADPQSDPQDPDYPLPNIEDPAAPIREPTDQPAPVNFGAIPAHWQSRDQKYGTRDMFWATFRAPKLPNDHDARYHNAAPDDQQFEHLDETVSIRCENMDPERPFRRIRLPGNQPRLFYVPSDDAARELREFAVKLDTVAVDLDAGAVTLVWRGTLEHTYNSFEESTDYMYLVEDHKNDLKDISVHQENFEKEIPQYEAIFEAKKISGESMHNKIFGPIVEQIAKSLQEVEADEALIEEFRNAETAQELLDLAKGKSDEYAEQTRTLLKDLEKKWSR